jgi:hypothetical protein
MEYEIPENTECVTIKFDSITIDGVEIGEQTAFALKVGKELADKLLPKP